MTRMELSVAIRTEADTFLKLRHEEVFGPRLSNGFGNTFLLL